MNNEQLEDVIITPHTYQQNITPSADKIGFSKATIKAVRFTEQEIDGIWVAIIGGEDNAK